MRMVHSGEKQGRSDEGRDKEKGRRVGERSRSAEVGGCRVENPFLWERGW